MVKICVNKYYLRLLLGEKPLVFAVERNIYTRQCTVNIVGLNMFLHAKAVSRCVLPKG
jgi:hypothetical protein